MKTIEYNGKVYEIGKYYLFGYSEDDVVIYRKLKTINTEDDYPFIVSNSVAYKNIKELSSSDNFGSITEVPVELEDGEVYSFSLKDIEIKGFYKADCNQFMSFYLDFIDAKECTNIRKMGVIEGGEQ